MAEVVVATSNRGKVREICSILAGLAESLVSLDAFPPLHFPEEGDDYAQNAAVKARTCALATGRLALADEVSFSVLDEYFGGHRLRVVVRRHDEAVSSSTFDHEQVTDIGDG